MLTPIVQREHTRVPQTKIARQIDHSYIRWNSRRNLHGLPVRQREKNTIEVRETFKVPKMGVIAGCSVRSGLINRQGRARVIRDGVEVYDGVIGSLRRFKDDVREVREGFECGIGIENFNDIKIGDVIECYRKEQVARTLTSTATA